MSGTRGRTGLGLALALAGAILQVAGPGETDGLVPLVALALVVLWARGRPFASTVALAGAVLVVGVPLGLGLVRAASGADAPDLAPLAGVARRQLMLVAITAYLVSLARRTRRVRLDP